MSNARRTYPSINQVLERNFRERPFAIAIHHEPPAHLPVQLPLPVPVLQLPQLGILLRADGVVDGMEMEIVGVEGAGGLANHAYETPASTSSFLDMEEEEGSRDIGLHSRVKHVWARFATAVNASVRRFKGLVNSCKNGV